MRLILCSGASVGSGMGLAGGGGFLLGVVTSLCGWNMSTYSEVKWVCSEKVEATPMKYEHDDPWLCLCWWRV